MKRKSKKKTAKRRRLQAKDISSSKREKKKSTLLANERIKHSICVLRNNIGNTYARLKLKNLTNTQPTIIKKNDIFWCTTRSTRKKKYLKKNG